MSTSTAESMSQEETDAAVNNSNGPVDFDDLIDLIKAKSGGDLTPDSGTTPSTSTTRILMETREHTPGSIYFPRVCPMDQDA